MLTLSDLDPVVVDAPQSGAIGGRIGVYTDIANLWSGSSGNYTIDFGLTTNVNSPQTSSFWILKSVTRPSISGNNHDRWTETIDIPSWAPPGVNRVIAIVDRMNAIPEGNESNNFDFDFDTIMLNSPKPDYDPSKVDAPATALVGSTFNVASRVDNLWSGTGGAFNVDYRFYNEALNSYWSLKTVSRPGISGNNSQTWTESITVPSWMPVGTYRMAMYVDPSNQIDEGNEQNNLEFDANTIVISAAAPPKPDYDPSQVDAPATAIVGSTFSVPCRVDNLWSGTGGAFNVEYRFYNESQTSYYQLKTVNRPGISGNNFQTWTESITVPSWIPVGTYRMAIYVDPANQIDEGNEQNNLQFDANTIVISAANYPESALRESQIRAEFTGFKRGLTLLNSVVNSSEYRAANDFTRLSALNKFRGAPNEARVFWIRGDLLRQRVGDTVEVLALLRPDSGSLTVTTTGQTTTYTIRHGNLFQKDNPVAVGTIENDGLYRINGQLHVSYNELSTEVQLIESGRTVLRFHNSHQENYAANVAPQLQQRITNLIIESRREGMNPRVASGTGYRSPAQQHRDYSQGRETPGRIVTNADAWQSNHQYGLAVDIALMNAEATGEIAGSSPDWLRLGAIGQSMSLDWGDRGYVDLHHFQWPGLASYSWQDLQRLYARGAGVDVTSLTATITTPSQGGLQEVWRTVGAL